jgi:uncharacterized membrane protein YgdD (TMEM256/DUF423 family)
MFPRRIVLIAAILGFTGVAFGAFGAHALKSTLEDNDRVDTYETASDYHLIHAVALLGVAWVAAQYGGVWATRAAWLMLAGTVVFSGSLYLLAITDAGFLGAVAPLGGLMLLVGWACVGLAVRDSA